MTKLKDMQEREKPHLSPTQVNMFLRCGEQWRRRYIVKDRIPPGIATVKGKAVHRGAEFHYLEKLRTGHDLPSKETEAYTVEAFHKELASSGVLFTPEEEKKGKSIVIGEATDKAASAAVVFAEEVAPPVKPKLVEGAQLIEVPDASHDLLVVLDLVAEGSTSDKNVIRDLKVSGKAKNQSNWDTDFQFTLYWLAAKANFGAFPEAIVVDQLVEYKAGPKHMPMTTARTKPDLTAAIHRLSAVMAGMNAGIFLPAQPGNWWCSPRWCGYWLTCQYVNSEREAALANGGEE